MLASLCATLALVVAATSAPPDRPAKRTAQVSKTTRDRRDRAAAKPRSPPKASLTRTGQGNSELTRARAQLAEVKRDPAKRRYRDRWEKAIAALEKAARGRDTAPALLDAARARYALYRYSQVEADRTAAVALARKAEKAGAREAKKLRLAIREEMGDGPEKDSSRPSQVRRASSNPGASIAAAPSARSTSPAVTAPAKTPRPTVATVKAAPPSVGTTAPRPTTGPVSGEAAAPSVANAATAPNANQPAKIGPGAAATATTTKFAQPPRTGPAATSTATPTVAGVPGAAIPTAPPARTGAAATVAATPFVAGVTTSRGPSTSSTPTARAAPPPRSVSPSRSASASGSDEEGSIDAILERALAGEAAPPEPEAASTHAQVSDLKSWSNHDYSRVAIYLSRNVSFQRVDVPPSPDRPRQIALDLRPAKLGPGLAQVTGDTLVQRVRAVQLDADTVRVTLDVARSDDVSIFPLEDPARLIVDVGAAAVPVAPPAIALMEPEPERGSETSPPAGSAAPGTPATPSPAPTSPSPAPRAPPAARSDELRGRGAIRRVIVDAGHGGHDTGAIGPTNVREKDVTLSMAKRLEKRLRARGYEVVLTRDDDRYVALEERTAIANARHGDLFVSLHANAHPRRDRRGVETYVLNVADDRYAARLAARENGAFGDANDIPVLRRILSDLDAKMSAESSRRVASAVQRELCVGLRARFGEVRDLGVKSALFYVLVGARMPAVLVETAFISNRAEEKRLASAAFQDEVANAVARAVDRVAAADARIAAAR